MLRTLLGGKSTAAHPPRRKPEPLDFEPTAQPKVSIVVPVYGKIDITMRCLHSLRRTGARIPFEVVVVDDCSPDDTSQVLAGVSGLVVHRNSKNLGFIGACNAGASVSRGEFLVFLNNDTEVSPDWLDELIETFEIRPDAGLVGSKLVYPDGRLQEAGGIVWRDAKARNYGRLENPDRPEFGHLREVDYCSGASIAIRRSVFESLGGFDSRYAPAYFEDTDLAFRVREIGLSVLVQPASVVIHHEGLTSGTDETMGIKRYQAINREVFFQRWQETLREYHFPHRTPLWIACNRVRKPVLLLVDSQFPRPDHDSGSVRIREAMLVAMAAGFDVRFLAADQKFSSPERIRDLERRGIQVLRKPWVGSPASYLRAHGQELDAVVLSRPRVFDDLWKDVRKSAPRAILVYDTVDLHHVRLGRQAQVSKDERLAKRAETYRRMEIDGARFADLTWTVSALERDLLQALVPGSRVRVLSNIHRHREGLPGFPERSGALFVGGFEHTANVDAVRFLLAEIWPKVRASGGGQILHVVGNDPPPDIQGLAAPDVRIHGYVKELEPILDSVRVMVAPLRYGAGVKGKINTALANRIAVVTTSVGAEGMGLENGRDARIEDDPTRFAEAILEIHADESVWSGLTLQGRRVIDASFGVEQARAELSWLHQDVLRRRGGQVGNYIGDSRNHPADRSAGFAGDRI